MFPSRDAFFQACGTHLKIKMTQLKLHSSPSKCSSNDKCPVHVSKGSSYLVFQTIKLLPFWKKHSIQGLWTCMVFIWNWFNQRQRGDTLLRDISIKKKHVSNDKYRASHRLVQVARVENRQWFHIRFSNTSGAFFNDQYISKYVIEKWYPVEEVLHVQLNSALLYNHYNGSCFLQIKRNVSSRQNICKKLLFLVTGSTLSIWIQDSRLKRTSWTQPLWIQDLRSRKTCWIQPLRIQDSRFRKNFLNPTSLDSTVKIQKTVWIQPLWIQDSRFRKNFLNPTSLDSRVKIQKTAWIQPLWI